MTTRPTVSRAQLDVLQAVARGEVSKPNHTGYDMGTWRVGGSRGRAVTIPLQSLIRKGLVQPYGATKDMRRYAQITDHGRALLDDYASRQPRPEA